MKRQFSLAGLLTLVASCSHEGSASFGNGDWDTGINKVESEYGASASDTYAAAVATLKSSDLTVDRDRHDERGGTFAGRRTDGSLVTVKVDAIDKNNSKVSVQVETGTSNPAQTIQDKIAAKLAMGKLKAAFFADSSEDAVYESDLETSLLAAERTAKALEWIVTGRELHDEWAQLEARSADSNPARFRIMHVDGPPRRTKVAFFAGNGNTDTSRTMISRMREEFDLQIAAHAR